MILVFLSMFGVMFLITQYFQLILGYSPLGAAVRFLPIAPIMMIVAPLTPRLSARFGSNRTVAAGMTLVGDRLPLVPRPSAVDTPYPYVLGCMLVLISRHRAHDVADDRGDHVGRAASPCGCGLGDERHDA